MPTMEWSDKLEVGLAPMDETHREFVVLYNELAAASGDQVAERLDAFIAHTEAHFGQENRWMEAVRFPGCHRAEHDRVLTVMRDVRERLVRGDVFLARRLIEELPAWFENHASAGIPSGDHRLRRRRRRTGGGEAMHRQGVPALRVRVPAGHGGGPAEGRRLELMRRAQAPDPCRGRRDRPVRSRRAVADGKSGSAATQTLAPLPVPACL